MDTPSGNRMPDDRNRPEATQTLPAGSLQAAQWLRGWLARNADNSKAARLLELLAQRALAAAERGEQPVLIDVGTLAREYSLEIEQANEHDPGKWVRSARMAEWWDSRESGRAADARRAGIEAQVTLSRRTGGGKGNQTVWGFRFEPLAQALPVADDPEPRHDGAIHYTAEPARLALPLRWLSPPGGFAMLSRRGLLLSLLVLANVILDLSIVWLALVVMLVPGAGGSASIAIGGFMLALAWGCWRFGTRPWLRLPSDRLVILPMGQLAFTQDFAQLHLVRRRNGATPAGWLSVVRHWAPCPICGSDVDLQEGGKAFPDRVVGRCAAAPHEHVYSFDPVLLRGRMLHQGGYTVPSENP